MAWFRDAESTLTSFQSFQPGTPPPFTGFPNKWDNWVKTLVQVQDPTKKHHGAKGSLPTGEGDLLSIVQELAVQARKDILVLFAVLGFPYRVAQECMNDCSRAFAGIPPLLDCAEVKTWNSEQWLQVADCLFYSQITDVLLVNTIHQLGEEAPSWLKVTEEITDLVKVAQDRVASGKHDDDFKYCSWADFTYYSPLILSHADRLLQAYEREHNKIPGLWDECGYKSSLPLVAKRKTKEATVVRRSRRFSRPPARYDPFR
jgi:hypothetical protein